MFWGLKLSNFDENIVTSTRGCPKSIGQPPFFGSLFKNYYLKGLNDNQIKDTV